MIAFTQERSTFEMGEDTSVGRWLRALRDRFLSKVVVDEQGCWIWQGYVPEGRYGLFSVADKLIGAHRVAYELFVGPIPVGMQIDHAHCDNTRCVNPAHLRVATGRDNTLRSSGPAAVNARKTHCKRGHAFTFENTYVDPRRGTRHCRACARVGGRDGVA